MIPKTIHYCWFGNKPLSEDARKCISSWKKYCPDYNIIEWNEKNFDINCNRYVKEAYEQKKWAFVSDYVRLHALYKNGGIYMDTDLELIKNIDVFLNDKAFLGFEDNNNILTAIMGSEKEHYIFNEMLNMYNNRKFVKENGDYDLTTNVTLITKYCFKKGFKLDNTKQKKNSLVIYPKDVFSPKSYLTGDINITDNTFTIHHFSGTWHSKKETKFNNFERKFRKKFSYKIVNNIINSIPYRLIKRVYISGVKKSLYIIIRKYKLK